MMVPCRVAMANSAQREFVVLRGPQSLVRYVADWLLNRVLAVSGTRAICLAGGSTPLLLYQTLAKPPWRDRFPWERIHWFWGDERFVRSDSSRSNYRMARAALFDHVPVPNENVHPIATNGTLAEAAADYERTLRQFYGSPQLSLNRPLFAVTLLGVGEDGHTASLFPGDAALTEQSRWVAAIPNARPEPRISLTYPALASSGEIGFLVTGASKRDIVARIRNGEDLPATRVDTAGRVHWFLDRAAAGASER